jgi:hypothetical protein
MKGQTLCTSEELDRLVGLHKRSRSLGCHDEVMFALFEALKANRREWEASELLRSYVTSHRRDAFSLDARLSSLLGEPTPPRASSCRP